MEYFIAILLYLPIILISFRYKKWYIYLLCAFLPILPDTFAIEISESLPLLTVSRILILLNLTILFIKNRRIKVNILPKNYIAYICVVLFISILNLTKTTQEINHIFVLVFENFFVVYILITQIKTNREFFKCIDFIFYGLLATSIVGILQTTLNFDVSEVFRLVEWRGEHGLLDRLGLVRAYGLCDSAIGLGCQLDCVIILTLYMFEQSNKKRYLIFCSIFIVALICTMTRGVWICLIIVLLLAYIWRIRYFLKKYLKYLIPIVCIFIGLILFVPNIRTVIVDPVISILNEVFGSDFSISENFGANESSGILTRTMQFSLFVYMIKDGSILFGYGYQAYSRGMLHFYYPYFNAWSSATALDVGFVGLLGNSGIIGLINYLLFIFSVLHICKSSHYKKDKFFTCSKYILILYILLNIVSSCIDDSLIILIIALIYSYKKLSIEKKLLDGKITASKLKNN